MSLILYYSPMSSAVTSHQALEELGVPYEKVKIDLKAGDQKKPAFLAINPNGKVPVLVHDGTPIFESAAILIHLGETFGVEKGLFPAPGPQRGEAIKWLVWCNVTLGDAGGRWMRNTSDRFPKEQQNAAAGAAAKKETEDLVGILAKALEGKKFLVGDKYSFADLQLAGWVGYMTMMGLDLAKWPSVGAWMKACGDRPAAKAAMAG